MIRAHLLLKYWPFLMPEQYQQRPFPIWKSIDHFWLHVGRRSVWLGLVWASFIFEKESNGTAEWNRRRLSTLCCEKGKKPSKRFKKPPVRDEYWWILMNLMNTDEFIHQIYENSSKRKKNSAHREKFVKVMKLMKVHQSSSNFWWRTIGSSPKMMNWWTWWTDWWWIKFIFVSDE